MLKRYLVIFLLSMNFIGYGQTNVQTGQKTINNFKIYGNLDMVRSEEKKGYLDYQYEKNENNLSFGNFSFAYEFSKRNKLSHEIELMPLSLNKYEIKEERLVYYSPESGNSISGTKITNIEIYTKYKYKYYFFNNIRKLNPAIGLSTGIIFTRETNKPITIRTFPVSNTRFFVPVELVAGIDVKVGSNFSLEINIPVTINQFILDVNHIENPQVSEKLRKNTVIYGILLPELFQLKFGLCYKINTLL